MANWPKNWRFCIFYLHFAHNMALLHLFEHRYPYLALQSKFLVLFCLCNHLFCPFINVQCSKWQIGFKIYIFYLHFQIWKWHDHCPPSHISLGIGMQFVPKVTLMGSKYRKCAIFCKKGKNSHFWRHYDVKSPDDVIFRISKYRHCVPSHICWGQGMEFVPKLKILYFVLPFCKKLALFVPFWAFISYLWLTKCSFGIASLSQPSFHSIYGFTVFQLENWP